MNSLQFTAFTAQSSVGSESSDPALHLTLDASPPPNSLILESWQMVSRQEEVIV
jgi:hypothetical protein